MILFICTGNTCRSPLASAFMKKRLEEDGISRRVESAGIYGYSGQPASHGSLNAAKHYGLTLDNHEAQNVIDVVGAKDALILTMTNAHKEYIHSLGIGREVYTLYEYVKKERKDITDPFGLNEEQYLKCAEEIKNLIYDIQMENL